jgi:hypothetical protein
MAGKMIELILAFIEKHYIVFIISLWLVLEMFFKSLQVICRTITWNKNQKAKEEVKND